jgi:hypothetical protein
MTHEEVFYNMSPYLAVTLVALPIFIPLGIRAIADLLQKEPNFTITLPMKIAYIVILTICLIGAIPAALYTATRWGAYAAATYVIFGFIFIAFAIAGTNEDDSSSVSGEPNLRQ